MELNFIWRMAVPEKIWIFRIIHISNLLHVIKHGLVTEDSPNANLDFVKIGDNSLIEYRHDLEVPMLTGGKFNEYIPFYLGTHSPMLYQIATGYEGIRKYPQEDIIYLASSFETIKKHNCQFVFTDGHARSAVTKFYSNEVDFQKLDWETIYSIYWSNDETDYDRQRRKQAEFFVKEHVPFNCIELILVFNNIAEKNVLHLLEQEGIVFPVQISKKAYYDNL